MQETTEATTSIPEITEVTSDLSGNISEVAVSVGNNSEIVTGMDPSFYRAAVKGDIDVFKQKGKDVEFLLTPNKNTVLHIHFTAYSDRISEEFVKEILSMCPSLVMKANDKDETLLHVAARYGHSEIVRILIEKAKAIPKNNANEVGAEKKFIRAINDKKDTALHEAARYHQTKVVKILTEEDLDHSYLVNSAGETPLYVAAERAYWDVVLKIVENCKSPTHDGPNGRTTLHTAVIHNNKEIGSKLLTGTSVEKEDENGWIPLHLAAIYGSPDLTELLLNYDKTIAYRRDRMGRTAFHLATYFGHVNVMKTIMSYCPDCPELVENKGRNALHYAVERNELMAARMILEDPSLSNLYNEKDEDGNTPFHRISKLTGKDLHSLLQGHPRVDQLAFNQQNQIVVDVALAINEQGESSKADVFPSIVSNIVPKEHYNIIETITIRQTKDEHDNTIETATISQSKDKHDSTIETATISKRKQEATISERKQEDVETATISQKKMEDAKTIETTFLVATLIATVTFAAGFTLPGGTFQEGDYLGSAILKHNLAFQAFVISDCIDMVLSASAVLMYLFLTFGEVRKNKDRYINYGFVATILTKLAMVSMIIAFVTGTYAVLGASKGIGLVTLLIGLSFFLVLCILVLKTAKHVKERSDS